MAVVFAVLADVSVEPSTEGMPGAELIQKLLNWLAQLALWGSLAAVLFGAAIYGVASHTGHLGGGYRGRQLVLAGIVGALLAGLADTAITMLFEAANSGGG